MWRRTSAATSFDGLDLAAHHAGVPVFEHAAHNVDLLSVEDLAQLLLVEPGASRTHDDLQHRLLTAELKEAR